MNGIADPTLAVMVDELLERGAKLDVWTDEEAELCRLVAFDVAQQRRRHADGSLVPQPGAWGGRRWLRQWSHAIVATERIFTVFEPDDFALHVILDPDIARVMARAGQLVLPKRRRARLIRREVAP